MGDSVVNVSGYDASYGIDAVQVGVGGGDFRQVLCVGDFSNSGLDGSLVTVDGSSLQVKDVNFGASAGLSASSFELSSSGDSPVADQVLLGAPGASHYIYLWGWTITAVGGGTSTDAHIKMTDGDITASNSPFSARVIKQDVRIFETSLAHPIRLSANTALKLTTVETANQLLLDGTVYYTVAPA